MGFTGAARAKLTQVEVILYQRNHTGQQQPLFTIGKRFRLITGRTQHQAQPFFLAECLASLPDLIQIDMGHLDRCHAVDADRRRLFIFLDKFIAQLHNAPDAAAEQAVILLRVFVLNRNILHAQVRELGQIHILAHIQMHRNHINNGMAAVHLQQGKNLLCFIRAYKVVRKNLLYRFNAGFNNSRVITAAILPQQKFQHIDRHIRALFDFLRQILADDAALEHRFQPLLIAQPRHAVAAKIIHGTLHFIEQGFIGMLNFFELLVCIRITAYIRVVLLCQAPVSRLDLIRGGRFADAQHRIQIRIIAEIRLRFLGCTGSVILCGFVVANLAAEFTVFIIQIRHCTILRQFFGASAGIRVFK